MNKCKILFAIILALVFIQFANAEKTVTDYYNAGCKALKKGKIEKAENNFLEAINIRLEKEIKMHRVDFSTQSCTYDIKQAKETDPKNDWRVYYYKGLLESNLIYDYRSFLLVPDEKGASSFIENASKELAIETLKKSISLHDNYQSHILLVFLDIEGEHIKALQLAKNMGYKEVAGNIEYGIGFAFESKEDFEEALVHYRNSLEYSWQAGTDKKIKSIIELMSKLKEQGITYQEYKRRKQEDEKRQREIATRRTWENLRKFLWYGGYASHIPIEKGDRILVPQYLMSIVDVDVVNGNYSYLFTSTGISEISQYAYIITKRQLASVRNGAANLVIEPLVIQCEGTASYRRGVSVVNTYVFSLVE